MRRGRRTGWARLGLECLEARTLPAGSMSGPMLPYPMPQAAQASGAVAGVGSNHSLETLRADHDVVDRVLASSAQEDWYRLDLLAGRLTAQLAPAGGDVAGLRLRLLRLDGQVLAESVGTAS